MTRRRLLNKEDKVPKLIGTCEFPRCKRAALETSRIGGEKLKVCVHHAYVIGPVWVKKRKNMGWFRRKIFLWKVRKLSTAAAKYVRTRFQFLSYRSVDVSDSWELRR